MKANKHQKKPTSVKGAEELKSKADAAPAKAVVGELSKLANARVSRRTLLKGTATAAAVVGVSVTTLSSVQLQPVREQSTSSSTTGYVTISPTVTNTATAPAPTTIANTSPFGFRTVILNVNGTNHSVNVEPRSMLVDVLRNGLGLVATKKPCNRMECGGCTVLIDGVPRESCSVIALRAVGHSIVTSEITTGDPVVNALQQAWLTEDGGQCCYCSPGFIMTATALLKGNPNPTVDQIKAGLSGNLCRCGNYLHIISAVQLAATNLGGA